MHHGTIGRHNQHIQTGVLIPVGDALQQNRNIVGRGGEIICVSKLIWHPESIFSGVAQRFGQPYGHLFDDQASPHLACRAHAGDHADNGSEGQKGDKAV